MPDSQNESLTPRRTAAFVAVCAVLSGFITHHTTRMASGSEHPELPEFAEPLETTITIDNEPSPAALNAHARLFEMVVSLQRGLTNASTAELQVGSFLANPPQPAEAAQLENEGVLVDDARLTLHTDTDDPLTFILDGLRVSRDLASFDVAHSNITEITLSDTSRKVYGDPTTVSYTQDSHGLWEVAIGSWNGHKAEDRLSLLFDSGAPHTDEGRARGVANAHEITYAITGAYGIDLPSIQYGQSATGSGTIRQRAVS